MLKNGIKTIVLIGPPGAGKGTLANEIAKQHGLPVLTTSQVLKEAMANDEQLAQQAKSLMAQGKFIDDATIFKVISTALADAKFAEGVVFDGFPRTAAQTDFFEENKIVVDLAVDLAIDDQIIIERMQGRRVHPASGRMYHVENMPPKVAGKDDVTGEDLIQRPDDNPEIVKQRLKDYHRLTAPVLDWAHNSALVKRVIKLDAKQNFSVVWQEFTQLLDR